MSTPLIPLGDVNFGLVTHDEPPKQSMYLTAGAPTRCFLPSCQKLFESTCFRGDDNHFYCSELCAHEGFDADLAVVEPIRKRT
jgi:hypothetical protein